MHKHLASWLAVAWCFAQAACGSSSPRVAPTSGGEGETPSLPAYTPPPPAAPVAAGPATAPPALPAPAAAPSCAFESLEWRMQEVGSALCPASQWTFTATAPGSWRASERGCAAVKGTAHVEGEDLIVDGKGDNGHQYHYVWHTAAGSCSAMPGTANDVATPQQLMRYQLMPITTK